MISAAGLWSTRTTTAQRGGGGGGRHVLHVVTEPQGMMQLQGLPMPAPTWLAHPGLLGSKPCRGGESGADPRGGATITAAGLWSPWTMTPPQRGGGGGFQRPRGAHQTNGRGVSVVTGADCDPGCRSTASSFCCAREEKQKKKEEEESRKHQNCPQQGPSCTKGTSSPACPSSQCCLWPGRAQRDLPEPRTALLAGPPAQRSLEEELLGSP